MRNLLVLLAIGFHVAAATPAKAQVMTLKCEAKPSYFHELLCAGDQRYCARYLQVDTNRRTVTELDQVETIEILNRFTGELTTSRVTKDAADRLLAQEAANQIAVALGSALKVVPLTHAEIHSCKTVQNAF